MAEKSEPVKTQKLFSVQVNGKEVGRFETRKAADAYVSASTSGRDKVSVQEVTVKTETKK